MKILVFTFVLICITSSVICTLSKSDRGKKKQKDAKTKEKKRFSNGEDETTKNTATVTAAEILEKHSVYSEAKQHMSLFRGKTLAYVTPWNNHGYDVAKWFSKKFSYISPVWLQLKRKPGGAYVIEGSHDIDKGWVANVTANGNTELMPRVLFDGWSPTDYNQLFNSEDKIEDCIDVLVKLIQKHKFAGVVVEIWSQLGGQKRKELIHFLKHMGETLHEHKKKMILVIPPAVYAQNVPGMFGHQEFLSLVDVVDRFSLMTYDFSNTHRPGPNSPIKWVRQCIELLTPDNNVHHRSKLLVGLNLYGNDYTTGGGGGPIVAHQYINILKTHKPRLSWESSYEEHILGYKSAEEDHVVFYPTLEFIKARLDLATEMGVGVSLWEVGQGLDYFYDLL